MVKLNKKSIEYLNDVYIKILKQYYDTLDSNIIKEIIDIINGNSKLSLRLIDWVVTKYSKNYLILLYTNPNELLNVYISYKSQLKNYTKKFFDPFKRGIIVDFKFKDNTSIKTTVGQLIFFKWIYENNIIQYIFNNQKTLYNKMYVYYVNEKKIKLMKDKKLKNEKKETDKKEITKSFVFFLN